MGYKVRSYGLCAGEPLVCFRHQMSIFRLARCALHAAAFSSVTLQTCKADGLPPWIQKTRPGSNAPWVNVTTPDRGFEEIVLGTEHQSATFTRNSLLVLPLLTEQECDALVACADAHAASLPDEERDPYKPPEALRLRIIEMAPPAQALTQQLLCDRLLVLLEDRLPQVVESLFGHDVVVRLRQGLLAFSFSGDEPCINRYKTGGDFEAHSDGYSLTVIIPLSKSGAYTGGGTLFWPEGPNGEREHQGVCEVLVSPDRGTAVVFNGNIRHAGRPVKEGVRHLFVASFDLLESTEEDD